MTRLDSVEQLNVGIVRYFELFFENAACLKGHSAAQVAINKIALEVLMLYSGFPFKAIRAIVPRCKWSMEALKAGKAKKKEAKKAKKHTKPYKKAKKQKATQM